MGSILAGISSNNDLSALSSSLLERESLMIFWFVNFMREGYGDEREECKDIVYNGPQTQYCGLTGDSELMWCG